MTNFQSLPDDALYLYEAALRRRSGEATLQNEILTCNKELNLIKEEWMRRIATSPSFKTKEEREWRRRLSL